MARKTLAAQHIVDQLAKARAQGIKLSKTFVHSQREQADHADGINDDPHAVDALPWDETRHHQMVERTSMDKPTRSGNG